VYILSNITT